jgi:hypothetical protein
MTLIHCLSFHLRVPKIACLSPQIRSIHAVNHLALLLKLVGFFAYSF